ncbi:MAG: DUF4136 domain-containing protein [Steroidobacteraceae bacterium]
MSVRKVSAVCRAAPCWNGPRRSFALALAVVTAAVMTLVAGCATTGQVGSDYDRAASFANYHTFTLMKREHHGTTPSTNPLVVQRAEDAIKTELQRRGYQFTDDPAAGDFAVDFTIGSQERTDINSYPDPYIGPGWGWGHRGWWGGPYWGDNLDVRQYREGTLSIDVFDARSHRPVWHGWAKKELSRSDMEHSAEAIRKSVDSVLAKFPPSG